MEGDTFDWKSILKPENSEVANVSNFNHVPCANIWKECVVPGIKLVTRHYDANPSRRSLATKPSYWVVTVMDVQGYFALVRYLGMGRDASQDFWIHMGKHEIHPVGKEMRTAIFMPPKFLLGKALDWRTYFVSHLTGAITLPPHFLPLLQAACATRASKYKLECSAGVFSVIRIGDHLEVLDKYNISQFRVGRVSKIVGCRLYLRYLDDNDDGFFCHEQSSLIHSMGWAACVGHKITLPKDYPAMNIQPPEGRTDSKAGEFGQVKEGMKLEAVDPLCPSRICAATICKVLEFGYMMVKMDCYDDQDSAAICKTAEKLEGEDNVHDQRGIEGNNNDSPDTWFCYHVKSPYIFKCGFCKRYGIPIVPPLGYEMNKFTWDDYWEKSMEVMAPLPEKSKLKHGFKTFMKLEMADVMNPTHIHPATITHVAGRLLRISFDGWEPVYDQWLDAVSPDIYPIGWSALVGHALEAPK